MRKKSYPKKENVVYFLPNLFTTANLFCGFYAIVASLQDFYIPAGFAILIAGIFDSLDGRIARLMKGNSRFGIEYDSLADLMSFGIAPAMLMYLWSIESFGRVGWLACFAFVACGALRLARFNIKTQTPSKSYFQGLPIPMAAYAIVTTVFIYHELLWDEFKSPFNLFITFTLAILMVSSIPYRSFKDFELKDKKSFGLLVFAIFITIIIAYNPGIMMFGVMMGYLLYGLLSFLWNQCFKQKPSRAEDEKPALKLIENKEHSS
ncbi:MAG: CDP-diacylglycerol--serine O-phosphatidyltransferase [Deltaproteobacteria bacterium]|nr:CDP-diacylglycerol--serine O-phosphatidyltransferase [Deltaproteobacteria bacterium]